MILEGDSSVIDAIKEKKRLMETGEEHGHIKPLLICGGGLMKGVYGAGALIALYELGYQNVFSTAGGISSGVPALAYFLSDGARHIASLAQDESCSPNFLKPWDFKNTVNIDYFLGVLQGATGKAIDFEKMFNSPTELLIAVSEFATGKAHLFSPTTQTQFLEAAAATISIPGVITRQVFINDTRFVDGASTNPYAMDVIYDTVDATHVLVLMNQDKGVTRSSILEYFINNILLRHRMSGPLLYASNRRHGNREKFAKRLLQTKNAAIVWGDNSVSSYEKNFIQIGKTIEKSREWWRQLLS